MRWILASVLTLAIGCQGAASDAGSAVSNADVGTTPARTNPYADAFSFENLPAHWERLGAGRAEFAPFWHRDRHLEKVSGSTIQFSLEMESRNKIIYQYYWPRGGCGGRDEAWWDALSDDRKDAERRWNHWEFLELRPSMQAANITASWAKNLTTEQADSSLETYEITTAIRITSLAKLFEIQGSLRQIFGPAARFHYHVTWDFLGYNGPAVDRLMVYWLLVNEWCFFTMIGLSPNEANRFQKRNRKVLDPLRLAQLRAALKTNPQARRAALPSLVSLLYKPYSVGFRYDKYKKYSPDGKLTKVDDDQRVGLEFRALGDDDNNDRWGLANAVRFLTDPDGYVNLGPRGNLYRLTDLDTDRFLNEHEAMYNQSSKDDYEKARVYVSSTIRKLVLCLPGVNHLPQDDADASVFYWYNMPSYAWNTRPSVADKAASFPMVQSQAYGATINNAWRKIATISMQNLPASCDLVRREFSILNEKLWAWSADLLPALYW